METQSNEKRVPTETPVRTPENPPSVEIPVQKAEPSLSIKQNISPIHQRAATIDFHEFSLNADTPKTEPRHETPISVPVPETEPGETTEAKMTRSNSVPSNSANLNFSSPRPSLDGLSEEKEVHRFSDVGNSSMPTRLRVRDFKPDAPAGEPSLRGKPSSNRGSIETESTIESVKSVVSRFGGSVNWKSQRAKVPPKPQTTTTIQSSSTRLAMVELEKIRRESAQFKMKLETMETSKAETVKELDHKNSLVEKIKLDLDQAETEESRVKEELHRLNQNLEIMKLSSEGTEQGVKVDFVKSRHEEIIKELKSVREEIKTLQEKYDILVEDKDNLVGKVDEDVSNSKKVEKMVEDLSEELVEVKKSLEKASAEKMEAEEHKVGAGLAKDEDCLTWKKKAREAQEKLEKLQKQILSAKDLEAKLEEAKGLLAKLNAELADFVREKEKKEKDGYQNEEEKKREEMLESTRKEILGVKMKVEKIQEEINGFQVEISSLKTELEKAKLELANMKQREGMATIAISSIETEIEKTKEQTNILREKEEQKQEENLELSKLVKEADAEAEKSKSIAKVAREEVKKAKDEFETRKNTLKTLEIKIHAATKEIEAYKMSEKIAVSAIKALERSEDGNITEKVAISFDEYISLNKRAHEAEQLAEDRIKTAIQQVENAKDSESNTLTKLNEMCKESEEKKKTLQEAEEKAIEAKDGKLAMEQELRKWRSDSIQRRKSDVAIKDEVKTEETIKEEDKTNEWVSYKPSSSTNSFGRLSGSKSFSTEEGDSLVHPLGESTYMSSPEEIEGKEKKKKKQFFPRVMMFMAKKKVQRQQASSSS